MPVTVKNITLWRKEVENQPGVLAATLGPLAEAGADLQVVMGYRFPGNESKGAIELYPITGRALSKAAQAVGLEASLIPTLLVQGDNKPGLGHAIARAIADAGVNVALHPFLPFIGRLPCARAAIASSPAACSCSLRKNTGPACVHEMEALYHLHEWDHRKAIARP